MILEKYLKRQRAQAPGPVLIPKGITLRNQVRS